MGSGEFWVRQLERRVALGMDVGIRDVAGYGDALGAVKCNTSDCPDWEQVPTPLNEYSRERRGNSP